MVRNRSRTGESLERSTETFVVRLWAEYLDQRPPTWRGEIKHVASKEVVRFATLSEMCDQIRRCASAQGSTCGEE